MASTIEATPARVERQVAEGLKEATSAIEAKKSAEILLFGNKVKFATEASKVTATSIPVAEHTGAVVASISNKTSIFDNSERYVAVNNFFSFKKTALEAALTSPERGGSSGDKKDDERNTFLSAHKSLQDNRFEALDKDITGIWNYA